jgi:dipeptidyl aminopeptidase/acylaminoacyl peptidase
MRTCWRVIVLISVLFELALGQGDVLHPPRFVVLEGAPKIPASISNRLERYYASSADSIVGWDPVKVEPIILRRPSNALGALYSVESPGASVHPIRRLPDDVYEICLNRRKGYLVFRVDVSYGAERMQLYRSERGNNSLVLLTDGQSKNYYPVFSNSGDRLMYSSTRRNRKHMDVYLIDPLDPKSDRMVAQCDGESWAPTDWSPDDRSVILSDFRMTSESYLWILDVATGNKTRLTDPPGSGQIYNGSYAQFSKDGKGVFHVTDRDSEFRRLAYVDIATKQYTYLTSHINSDVEELALSPDRSLLAFTTNENGLSRLRLLDATTRDEIRSPQIPNGVINTLVWHNDSAHLGFRFTSGKVPGDIYSIDVRDGKLQRWTSSQLVSSVGVPEPDLIKWKSFDRMISGLLYRPPSTFTGRRPVIIQVHGGPSEQVRPTFRATDNYFTSELGAVMIYPNIRGSTGYGKRFVDLDNGHLRQDAIKDIGALLDWIKTAPGLDPNKVLIRGHSYGGYVALSVATHYSKRICGAISFAGQSNLVTFLENTDISRKDRRRAEYGDEREPNTRQFLESIAPVNLAGKIQKPLLIIHGRNDTRVPFSEAVQMVVAARKSGNSVWYLLGSDDGHYFADFQAKHFSLCTEAFFATTVFAGN